MLKKTGKKSGTKGASKKEHNDNVRGSCGIDSSDLFVIQKEFDVIDTKSRKRALKYLEKQAKRFDVDFEELQQSLLEGVKRDESDVAENGTLYGTMGDDEFTFNINRGFSSLDTHGVRLWAFSGDDTIVNNVRYINTSLLGSRGTYSEPHMFFVRAWGGGGLDEFVVGKDASLKIMDMGAGETVTLTGLEDGTRPQQQSADTVPPFVPADIVEVVPGDENPANYEGADVTVGTYTEGVDQNSIYTHPQTKVDVIFASSDLVLVDMGKTDDGGGYFSQTFKAIPEADVQGVLDELADSGF